VKFTGLRGWIGKSSENKASSSVEKMEGNGEFDNKPLKVRGKCL